MSKNISPQPHSLNTAVLFMIFNRPDTTSQVFETIRLARPPRLYVAADGPRNDRPGEEEKVRETRNYVIDNIDWECEVHTLFRNNNLGCKYAVSSAIAWFFEHEDMGIILEDDCLPSQSFFWFCEDLLNKYVDDERVGLISGRNNLSKHPGSTNVSYYFSHGNTHNIWGWATWRRVAERYDPNHSALLNDYILYRYINDTLCNSYEAWYLATLAAKSASGEIDTWDFQWIALQFMNSQYSIIPRCNLVKNIGFHEYATHTVHGDDELSRVNKDEINFPLVHPPYIIGNRDLFFRQIDYRKPTYRDRINAALRRVPLLRRLYRTAKKYLINSNNYQSSDQVK